MYRPAYARIPAAEEQTDMRKSTLYWITQLEPPGGEPRWATWMVRSPHNPDNPYWGGVEVDAIVDESPNTKVAFAAGKILGIMPRFTDLVAVWQPRDHPAIEHTTFVHTAAGRAPGDPNKLTLPRPVLGVQLGIFPLDELPLDEMRPHEAALLPEVLTTAVQIGLSEFRAEYVPSRDQRHSPPTASSF